MICGDNPRKNHHMPSAEVLELGVKPDKPVPNKGQVGKINHTVSLEKKSIGKV
jgi:hypothetical protein